MKQVIKRRSFDVSLPHQLTGLDPVLTRIFLARGCTDTRELDYRLGHLLPPTLKGMKEACDLLVEALKEQRKILIVGDFDVDGATSTTLMVKCLRAFGAEHVDFAVPNRFEFGYGLTPEIVEYCKDKEPELIITVDNGISSIEGVEYAHSLGIKVLITDHHLPGNELPKADAIVNPNQPGCDFPVKALAGVGVAFYVLMALRKALNDLGWFNEQRPMPELSEYLDLVALGTVADVVPLEHNNRILVNQGLRRIRHGVMCEGVRALLTVSNRDYARLQASDLGFAIGPRLNAAGRLSDMTVGIKCLLSDDPDEAKFLADRLDTLNQDRREIEATMQEEATALLDELLKDLGDELPNSFCLYHPDWHQGVIGILASRVKERLNRPVIVFADDDVGLKGSGRSVPGVHLKDAMEDVATNNKGLLSKFGGHAMAAGLSLEKEKLAEFTQALEASVSKQIGSKGIEAFVESDGSLDAGYLSLEFAETLASYGPWGQGFPEPTFDGEFTVQEYFTIKDKHLKLILSPLDRPEVRIPAIKFNAEPELLESEDLSKVKAVYKLSINEFRGMRSLQLMLEYLESESP